MASINRVTLIGNLGAAPEMNQTSNGQKFVKLRLATNENYQDRNGEWQKSTEWHTVKIWGASSDRAVQQLRKGSLVYIEGSLRSYEMGEGNPGMGQGGNRSRVWEVKALTWRSLDPKENRGGSDSYPQTDANAKANQGFGGNNQGFGGNNQSFGGNNQGFGGNNQGFGGNNQGFGGNNQGFGGNNQSFGGNPSNSNNPGGFSAPNWGGSNNGGGNQNWGSTPSAPQSPAPAASPNNSNWGNPSGSWGAVPSSNDNNGDDGGDDNIPF